MPRRCLSSGLLLCFGVLFSHPAGADETREVDPKRLEFVVGNAYFVLLHEVAHMVLEDFDIPVLGSEEEAADTLAATTLLRLDQLSGDRNFRFTRMLVMAADANRIFWNRGIEMQAGDRVYWANHPLSVQRAARIACLVYGSDGEAFAGLPEIADMPYFRAGWCEEEYAAAEHARIWVRNNTKQPKRLRAGGEVAVEYEDPDDESHLFIRSLLQRERILENTAEYVAENFRMPGDVSFAAVSCGEPNAYWDGEDRRVMLCYELLAAFYALSEEQKVVQLEERLRALAENG